MLAVKAGAYWLFDEPNLCQPGVVASLNNVLDRRGELAIPETGERLRDRRTFRAFLCFNSGYSGTRQFNEALVDSRIQKRMADLGGEVTLMTPAQFGKLVSDETEKWAKVVKAANLSIE